MRNSSKNMQHIYRRKPMQKCVFNKFALHCLLLKSGPRNQTWTLETDPEKSRSLHLAHQKPEKQRDTKKVWKTTKYNLL